MPAHRPTVATMAASWARTREGSPYHWNTAGPGQFDCSGLVVAAFLAASEGRIALPHNTVQQRNQCPRIGGRDKLIVGDLVFSYGDAHVLDRWGGRYGNPTHVGIYLGHGQVVQATDEQRGVEIIGIDAYVAPSSFGRVKRAQVAA